MLVWMGSLCAWLFFIFAKFCIIGPKKKRKGKNKIKFVSKFLIFERNYSLKKQFWVRLATFLFLIPIDSQIIIIIIIIFGQVLKIGLPFNATFLLRDACL